MTVHVSVQIEILKFISALVAVPLKL